MIALFGSIILCVFQSRDIFIGESMKDADSYVLRFEKMNRADFHVLYLQAGEALDVDYHVSKGHVDIHIGMNGKKPVYTGNDIESGTFAVIIPENGEYTIAINARHASGSIMVSRGIK